MLNERLFLVVDDANPADQAAQLQHSLKSANLPGDVRFVASPAEMYEFVQEVTPTVILLDHHWPEVKLETVLTDLRRAAPGSRVVVYTGKKLNPSSVIECARFGVAEYLQKGSLSGDTLAKKLSLLASNPNNTIERLSAPSGAVQQLIQEAEKAVVNLDTVREHARQLEAENASLKSAAWKEIFQPIMRVIGAITYVCFGGGLIYATARWTDGGYLVFAFCLFIAFGGLVILDRSVSEMVVRFGESQFGMKRESRTGEIKPEREISSSPRY